MRKYCSKGKKRGKSPTDTRNIGPFGGVRLRPLIYEILEDRRLLSLSNMSLLAAQQTALENGLQGLATWSNSLDQYGLLAQQLPIVDQSVGSALNLNGILQNQLATPMQSALSTASNSNAVVSALQQLNYTGSGLAVTVANVTGGEVMPQANELQFNLVFDATRAGLHCPRSRLECRRLWPEFPWFCDGSAHHLPCFQLHVRTGIAVQSVAVRRILHPLRQPDGGVNCPTGRYELYRPNRRAWCKRAERFFESQCLARRGIQPARQQRQQQYHAHRLR